MIRTILDTETEKVWTGEQSRKLPPDIQDRALLRLRMLHRAKTLDDLRHPQSNRRMRSAATEPVNTAFPSTTNGVSGATEAPIVSKSPTTIDPDWLHNPHAGEMLASEFIEPSGMNVAELAQAIEVRTERLAALIDGVTSIDAELDLRLTRYFRMSEGFFLGLQLDYELLEAKRALNGMLDRIVPRAA